MEGMMKEEKRTLLNAVQRLEKRTASFGELLKVSETLVSTMERSGPILKKGSDGEAIRANPVSLVDQLYAIEERLGWLESAIGTNVQRVIDMIE